jgi:YD repeat-containing protein
MLVLSVGCYAQSTPDQEYQKLIQVDPSIQPLGEHPFGENINLYDGSISFNVTDVTLRGNGPTITVGRTGQFFEWVFEDNITPQLPFSNWDLDIPRIETLAASQLGWQTGVWGATPTVGTTNRCSTFDTPPGIASSGGGGWVPDDWWYGYNLLVPGEGKQLLMQRGTANSPSPTISGKSFSIVTKNNWMIGCGVLASDGGEGFLAIAPDGTRYTFAHLVYRPWYRILGAGALTSDATHLAKSSVASARSATPMMGAPGGIGILNREEALMYVTQVQDRFGNTLTYNYDPSTGYLSSITASDGREVDVTYISGSQVIQTITAKAANAASRTWTYTYGSSGPGLTGVQLPDGSAWSYNLPVGPTTYNVHFSNCQLNLLPPFTYPVTGGSGNLPTITAPSGLTGTFNFGLKLSGRSYTPKECYGDLNGTAPSALYPEWYVQPAITSEVLSGPGMPAQSWSYSYSPANQSWSTDTCATSGTCVSTVYTDVVVPEGNDTRYTFSNRFDATEGQLKQTDYYSGAAGGTLLRSEVNTYANPTGGPWPTAYGADMLYRDNQAQVTELSPMSQRVTTQSGDTYTWKAAEFNAYAQPTDVKRHSSITGQTAGIEETTSYRNDPNFWVLGLPLQVTNVATGEVESDNTYATNDTLLTRARFGQPLMSYTFNTAGQLASFTDGNSHTTSLSNYKRGIPQTINYPDSTSETLIVDDLGQITRINDQAGHGTAYSYDPVGRVTAINYSGGDEVAWAPQSFAYSFVTSAERGVAANHWKRTATLGGANTVTYFDAMLRSVLSDSDIGSTVQSSTLTTYDSKGQKLFSAYPSATALTYTPTPTVAGITTTYDALERVTQVQQSSELGTLTSSTAYLSGAKQQVTDPKGNVTTISYQVFDEPSYDNVLQVQAPTGITQTVVRNVYGNPLSITQSGLYGTESDSVTKTLTYDSYHRLCRTTEPESGSEVMAYDAANNLAWSASGLAITGTGCGQEQVAAAAQTARTYDAMNRVKTILPPAGTQSTTYGYDPVGRMTSAVTSAASGNNTWSGTYNFRGMLTGESLQVGSQSPWAIGYAHDANGSLSLVHYPDGENVSYTPDALGRPTQVGSYATSIGYFPNGQISEFVYGNGTGYAAEQNARQLLSNFSYGTASTAQLSEDLAYDKNANITTVTDLVAGGPRSKSFGYDALNRLTSATATGLWGSQAYTYDGLNNLRTLQTNGQTAAYTYDATNKLTSVSGAMSASFTYDPRGNVATKNGTTLLFDQKKPAQANCRYRHLPV